MANVSGGTNEQQSNSRHSVLFTNSSAISRRVSAVEGPVSGSSGRGSAEDSSASSRRVSAVEGSASSCRLSGAEGPISRRVSAVEGPVKNSNLKKGLDSGKCLCPPSVECNGKGVNHVNKSFCRCRDSL